MGPLTSAFDSNQVVELRLDVDDHVIDRRAIPYPYPKLLDAVETIDKLMARLKKIHYRAERDFGSAVAEDGKRGLNSLS